MHEKSDVAEARATESLAVMRAQLGERSAFVKLHERYHRRLLYFVRRMLQEPEEAEDVLQDVWILVVKKIRSLEDPVAFRAWLYRIAHRQALSRLRRSRREVGFQDLEELLDTQDPQARASEPQYTAALFAGFGAEEVHAGLRALPLHHRDVLTLRFLEDLPYEAIAEIVGVSVGTVRSRLHYAKTSLQTILERNRK